ncbi:MAG: ABC transporter ATP-binding protein [Erysipelotrichaceae bacterium]|nr:ABC transporter ATP-binding protein [Erysipelotrichaceae bacterium]
MNFYSMSNETEVLKNVDLKLHKGEILAIVGPSGCGKSTILNIISGLLEPTKGEVVVKGKAGYMFQKDNLFEWRTIYQNITLGLEIKKIKDKKIYQRIDELLKKYGLWEFKNSYPNELSGGMRQRVALIRTLVLNPNILLLDESFSALDYQTRLLVNEDVYKIIKEENKSTIMVTHDISEAIAMADRIILLSKRPASIKKIYDINLSIEGKRTPLKARDSKEFKEYFQDLWKELNSNE